VPLAVAGVRDLSRRNLRGPGDGRVSRRWRRRRRRV